MKLLQSIKIIVLVAILFLSALNQPAYGQDHSFKDVPKDHWAEAVIHQMRTLHITEGIGNNQFGLGKTISKAEFVTFLVRVSAWDILKPSKGSFSDNQNVNAWYFSYIETALSKGVLINDGAFHPQAAITREEMALMMVRALGYDPLALQLNNQKSAFTDVSSHKGYMNLLKDFGIVLGSGNNLYKPYTTATREEAAAILIRMYNKLQEGINQLHAFYSNGSSSQKDLISNLSSISFDWLSLSYDAKSNKILLNSTLPSGYSETVDLAKSNSIPTQLMLLADNSQVITLEDGSSSGLVEYILKNETERNRLIEEILSQLTTGSNPFDGITIDFESMKGAQMATLFNDFLTKLNEALDAHSKNLYVTVHPKTYYDGYDYKTIGEIADYVILMAHDYETKKLSASEMSRGYTNTPLTPIVMVYNALKEITDPVTGVADPNKIWLQIAFSAAQWQLVDGQVINASPYIPTYAMIEQRLVQEGVEIKYDKFSQNPYATYYNATSKTDNKIWYEDSRSVLDKVELARMFGIQGISLWRLGNIPDNNDVPSIYFDVWNMLQAQRKD